MLVPNQLQRLWTMPEEPHVQDQAPELGESDQRVSEGAKSQKSYDTNRADHDIDNVMSRGTSSPDRRRSPYRAEMQSMIEERVSQKGG